MNLHFSLPVADLYHYENRTKLLRFANMLAVFTAALYIGNLPSLIEQMTQQRMT